MRWKRHRERESPLGRVYLIRADSSIQQNQLKTSCGRWTRSTIGRSLASTVLLIDVNLLVYAHLKLSPFHPRAHAWLDEQLRSPQRIAMPWLSLLGFLRVSTNPRALIRAESVSGALKQLEEWLAHDRVWVPQPTERHHEILAELLIPLDAGGNTVPDAHLAALAIEYGLTLCSNDRGFARFPKLRWINPLEEP